MCAIIGVLGKRLPRKEQFKKARDTMTHRGPDDCGLYYVPREECALGHRRLAIIDTSPAGVQPFFSHDRRYIIVYNGEIYNYKELKKELKHFYPFSTGTDTEVLLAAYIKWGEKALQRLNGMFAFAVWDRKKKELFIARDRLGIKPLYYSTHNGKFYFSSEIKGILEASEQPRKLNKRGLLDYLSYRYPLGENTFFENIYSLLPGQYVNIKNGTISKPKKYWELPIIADKKDPGEKEVLKTTEELLKKTVNSHMISDVPVGAYLSGGIDSSVLVAFMAELSENSVKTFSVGFKEDGFNEFREAQQVAKMLGTEHRELLIDNKKYLELLPEVIAYKDAPLHVPNEVPLYALSRELKKHITVVLSGEGADELFGGYGRIFRSGYDAERIVRLKENKFDAKTKTDEILLKNLKAKYGKILPQSSIDILLSQYQYSKSTDTKSLLNGDVFDTSESSLLNRHFFEEEFFPLKGLGPCDQYMHFFERVHLLGILGRLDNAAMGASVEGRVPYIDHMLVEYVSSLPAHYKLRWKSKNSERSARVLNSDQISDVYDTTKYLLRKIGEKYLPEEIAHRRKLGFPVPLNEWAQKDLGVYGRDVLLSKSARTKEIFNTRLLEKFFSEDDLLKSAHNGRLLWMLINVELWMREYHVEV